MFLMKDYFSSKSLVSFLFVVGVIFAFALEDSDGQTRENTTCSINQSDPNYPLVNIKDGYLSSGTKVYQATVGMTPLSDTMEFNWTIFHDTAVCYYGGSNHAGCKGCKIDGDNFQPPPLNGFNGIYFQNTSTVTGLPEVVLLVTYNISYDVTEMQRTPGIEGTLVEETIGNFQEISSQLGKETCDLNKYYNFRNWFTIFGLIGFNVCSNVACKEPYLFCIEDLANEFTACCKSACNTSDYECINDGKCKHVNADDEPQCFCSSGSNSFWYIGEKCQYLLAVWMIVVAIVLSFLAILIAILIACCCYHSRKRKREKELALDSDQMNDQAAVDNEAYTEDDKGKDEGTTEDEFEEPYEEQRLSDSFQSSSSDDGPDPKSLSSADSWSLDKLGSITSEDINNIKTVTFEEDFSSQAWDHTSSNINNTGPKLRPGWTPSLGPQTLGSSQNSKFNKKAWLDTEPQLLGNDPNYKKFSPDTNI